MMWEEFERIAGYEVSYEDYTNVIEPMYNATNLTKTEFVKTLNRKAFDLKVKKQEMIDSMKAIAQERKENAEHFTNYEAEDKLVELAHKYAGTFHRFSTPQIDRKLTFGDCGCSYPSELIIFGGIASGNYYEIERIKLA